MKHDPARIGREAMQDPKARAKWRANYDAAMQRPEVRTRIVASNRDPGNKAKRLASYRRTMSDPARREKLRRQRREAMKSKSWRANISRGQKRRHQLRRLQKAVDCSDIDGARKAILAIAKLDKETL